MLQKEVEYMVLNANILWLLKAFAQDIILYEIYNLCKQPVYTAVVSQIIMQIFSQASYSWISRCGSLWMFVAKPFSHLRIPSLISVVIFFSRTAWHPTPWTLLPSDWLQQWSLLWGPSINEVTRFCQFLLPPPLFPLCHKNLAPRLHYDVTKCYYYFLTKSIFYIYHQHFVTIGQENSVFHIVTWKKPKLTTSQHSMIIHILINHSSEVSQGVDVSLCL